MNDQNEALRAADDLKVAMDGLHSRTNYAFTAGYFGAKLVRLVQDGLVPLHRVDYMIKCMEEIPPHVTR